jgi:hypothetical protein
VRQPGAHILLCQGDADDFTAAEAYDTWADGLGQLAAGGDDTGEGENEEEHQQEIGGDGESEGEAERTGNVLEVVRISGASHFWGGQASRGLIESVTQFLA